jgi:hypothetical protein
MSPPGSLSDLASKISAAAASIDSYLQANKLPSTSLNADSPMALPHAPEVNMARIQLVELLTDMQILAYGPTETVAWGCIQVIWHPKRTPVPKFKNLWLTFSVKC